MSDAGSGPFPGDVAVFTLSLYAKPDLKQNIGSAAYTCYYNDAKRALCMAYYEMNGGSGTLLASGLVNFDNSERFELVVTGGTNRYKDARGAVSAVAAGSAERVDFQLLGPR